MASTSKEITLWSVAHPKTNSLPLVSPPVSSQPLIRCETLPGLPPKRVLVTNPFPSPNPLLIQQQHDLSDLPIPPQSGTIDPEVISSSCPSGMGLGSPGLSCSLKVTEGKTDFWLKETLPFLGAAYVLKAFIPLVPCRTWSSHSPELVPSTLPA